MIFIYVIKILLFQNVNISVYVTDNLLGIYVYHTGIVPILIVYLFYHQH